MWFFPHVRVVRGCVDVYVYLCACVFDVCRRKHRVSVSAGCDVYQCVDALCFLPLGFGGHVYKYDLDSSNPAGQVYIASKFD